MDEERIKKLVRELIIEIGEDPTREGLTKTPERIANAYKELLDQIFKIISKENISGFIIQPTTSLSEPPLEQLLMFYDSVYPYYNEVRVVPQLQKIISAP